MKTNPLVSLLMLIVLSSVGQGQKYSARPAERWIEALNLAPIGPSLPYFTLPSPFGGMTDDLPSGFQSGSRFRGSFSYSLLTPEQNHYPFYIPAGAEIITHIRGRPVDLYFIDPASGNITRNTIGPFSQNRFQVRLPAGQIMAIDFKPRKTGAYALLGVVSIPAYLPGDSRLQLRASLLEQFPQHSKIIQRLATPTFDIFFF